MMKHFNLLILLPLIFFSTLADDDDLPMPRDQHYGFAHRIMVREMMRGKDFLEEVEKQKARNLRKLWKEAREGARDDKRVSNRGLDYKVYKIDKESTVFIVILPKAEQMAEAHMVGCLLSGDAPPKMIYTLEKSDPGNMLCAWTKGKHLNYGAGPKTDVIAFKKAILKHSQKN